MTATSDGLLDGLVEGSTYRVGVSALPDRRVRWSLALYETIAPETATLLGRDPGERVWNEVAHREDGEPTEYRAVALAWLAEVAPGAMDCVLLLPDGNERIRSQSSAR